MRFAKPIAYLFGGANRRSFAIAGAPECEQDPAVEDASYEADRGPTQPEIAVRVVTLTLFGVRILRPLNKITSSHSQDKLELNCFFTQ